MRGFKSLRAHPARRSAARLFLFVPLCASASAGRARLASVLGTYAGAGAGFLQARLRQRRLPSRYSLKGYE